LDQSRSLSISNAKRIQFLETQVAEIGAITREEIRDVKGKIEECLAAVDIREQEHKNDRERYEHELAERERQYSIFFETMKQQYVSEKQRLEQEVTALGNRISHLQKVMKQLDKQHDVQLRTTLGDVEKMKGSLYQSMTRGEDLGVERNKRLAEERQIRMECREIEGEIGIVEKEIVELKAENEGLRFELSRLDGVVYGK
jgi:transketolase